MMTAAPSVIPGLQGSLLCRPTGYFLLYVDYAARRRVAVKERVALIRTSDQVVAAGRPGRDDHSQQVRVQGLTTEASTTVAWLSPMKQMGFAGKEPS